MVGGGKSHLRWLGNWAPPREQLSCTAQAASEAEVVGWTGLVGREEVVMRCKSVSRVVRRWPGCSDRKVVWLEKTILLS